MAAPIMTTPMTTPTTTSKTDSIPSPQHEFGLARASISARVARLHPTHVSATVHVRGPLVPSLAHWGSTREHPFGEASRSGRATQLQSSGVLAPDQRFL